MNGPALLLALTALATTVPHGLAAQEMDKAIFHYSAVDVHASSTSGPALASLEGAGWIGTDFDRIWWRASGEGAGGGFPEADAALLYGRYVRRFWDVVIGYKHRFEPVSQGYLALGFQGLAPYWFEVSLLGLVSDQGRPSLELEAENDLYITQRLVLQGRVEWLLTADDRLRASGVDPLELGLRTRYEFRRKLAPYLDITWVREGGSAPVPGSGDADADGLRLGFGVRVIY